MKNKIIGIDQFAGIMRGIKKHPFVFSFLLGVAISFFLPDPVHDYIESITYNALLSLYNLLIK